MAAEYRQQYKISAKDNTSVTLVPVTTTGETSLRDTGRTITQIVITSSALADHNTEKFFSNLNRVFEIRLEKR